MFTGLECMPLEEAVRNLRERCNGRVSYDTTYGFIKFLNLINPLTREDIRGLGKLLSYPFVAKAAQELGIYKINKRYKVTLEPIRWDEFTAYTYGYFIGDGCMHVSRSKNGGQLDISSKDEQIIKEFSERLGVLRYTESRKGETKCYRMLWTSKVWYEFLLSLGCEPAKSKKDISYHIPCKYTCAFLRGLIDSDGYITTYLHKGRMCITVGFLGNKTLVEDVGRILNSLGIKHTLTRSRELYAVSFGSRDSVMKYYNLVYKDSTIKLLRKYKKLQEYVEIISD